MSNGTGGDERGRREWWVMVALLATGFVTWTLAELRQSTLASWQDTEGYLAHSMYIAEHGGFLGFLRECFAGTYPIVERHPLYMLLLAPFATRTPEFFFTAKVLNLVTGLVVLLTLVWMVSRRYGRGPALIAGFLYALSTSLVTASSHVNHETQLVLCTLWTWWFLTGPGRGQDPVATGMPESSARWALAGMWLGLAYMVKSSAMLILMAVVVAGLWHGRLRFLASPRLWVLLLTAAIVASPLLVRNVRGFGTPFYEGFNSHSMWMDSWDEMGGEHSVMFYDRYAITTIERNQMPTAMDYVDRHGPVGIAKRMLKGLYKEVTKVAPKALSPAFPLPTLVGSAWGLAVFGFAVAGWFLVRRSWDAVFVFFLSAGFVTLFGWDKLFPDIRYLAPVVPIWIALAGHAMHALHARLMTPQTAWRLQRATVLAVVLVLVGWTVASGAFSRPQPLLAVSPSYSRLIDWLNTSVEPGDRVLLGPTTEFFGLIWMVERPVTVIHSPEVSSLEAFQQYLSERNVRYIVMNTENAQGQRGKLKAALAPFVEVTSGGAIVEKQPLPGWRQVYSDPETPRRFIIYEAEAFFR